MQENIILGNKQFLFTHSIRDDDLLRESFNQLAEQTFQVSFENWYQQGYWGDSYISNVLVDNNKVVANASVNIIKTRWHGSLKTYLQLGTVMTDIAYRGQGLANFLIKKIMEDWQAKVEAIYLYANNTVLDFYPKYGFEAVRQYQCYTFIKKQLGKVRKLNMALATDREILFRAYKYSNPFAMLPMIDNQGLLMFYCGQLLADNIFYSEDSGVVAVIEYNETELLCYDIFGETTQHLVKVLGQFVKEEESKVRLGFSPINTLGFNVEPYMEDDLTLFFYSGKENPVKEHRLMLPLLSHA